MKKYIISEDELRSIVAKAQKHVFTSIILRQKDLTLDPYAFFLVDMEEYKEPETDMHYIGGQWHAKTGESQAVAQNVNAPKFKEGDVVYYAYCSKCVHQGVVIKRHPTRLLDEYIVHMTYFGGDYPVREDHLFKTPQEAFDFLEREK